MTKTPEEWLSFLTARMDKERPRTDLLRSYTNGSSPLPEMGPNLAKAWLKFQRRARTNPGKLVVSALADRLIPNGVTVGASEDSPAARAAARAAGLSSLAPTVTPLGMRRSASAETTSFPGLVRARRWNFSHALARLGPISGRGEDPLV